MIKELNDFSNEVGYDIISYSNDEITTVTSIDPDSQTIVIFDDFVCEKEIKKLLDYFMQGRNKSCSVLYLSQSFFDTPKCIRINCTHYILYDCPSKPEITRICNEFGVTKDQYFKATKKPYLFLYVDKPMK